MKSRRKNQKTEANERWVTAKVWIKSVPQKAFSTDSGAILRGYGNFQK
jgi:hypothetical protein